MSVLEKNAELESFILGMKSTIEYTLSSILSIKVKMCLQGYPANVLLNIFPRKLKIHLTQRHAHE